MNEMAGVFGELLLSLCHLQAIACGCSYWQFSAKVKDCLFISELINVSGFHLLGNVRISRYLSVHFINSKRENIILFKTQVLIWK